jgi:hypothetical protein
MNIPENDTNEIDSNMHEANVQTEAQVARYIANLLDDHAQHVTAVTVKRLSAARSLAVKKLASQQTQVIQHNGNTLSWFGSNVEQYIMRHRTISAAVILAAMLLTFFAAQQFSANTNLENSDAFLLASDLPPEAYADKGFDTWLVSKRD